MLVRMVTTAAGPNGVWPAGSVVNVDRDQADVLIKFGYAVAVEVLPGKQSAPVVEVAMVDPVAEAADAPVQKSRRRAKKG